jgi:hypothetical protein
MGRSPASAARGLHPTCVAAGTAGGGHRSAPAAMQSAACCAVACRLHAGRGPHACECRLPGRYSGPCRSAGACACAACVCACWVRAGVCCVHASACVLAWVRAYQTGGNGSAGSELAGADRACLGGGPGFGVRTGRRARHAKHVAWASPQNRVLGVQSPQAARGAARACGCPCRGGLYPAGEGGQSAMPRARDAGPSVGSGEWPGGATAIGDAGASSALQEGGLLTGAGGGPDAARRVSGAPLQAAQMRCCVSRRARVCECVRDIR